MNQWRNRSLGAFVAMSLFFAFTLGAQDANTEKAVAYLVSEQDEEGGWNQNKQKRIVDSLESFRALQRVNGGETALNNALNLTMGQIFNTKVTAFVIPDVILKIQDIVWGWIFFKAVNQKETKEDIRAEINRQIRVYYS